MNFCRKVLVEKGFGYLMNMTFFGYFVVGEDEYSIILMLERL